MKYILTVIIILAAMTMAVILFALSGMYNIAATEPHWSITSSFIEMLRENSVEAHSKDVQTPNLKNPKLKEAAFPHYHEMCRLCHGAPGHAPKEFGEGLYPAPPSMTSGHIQKESSDGEIYWVVKHGIKMTGMPAFGATHDENEMWGIVALVKEMPRMGPERYRQYIEETIPTEGETNHDHNHREPAVEKDPDHGHGEHSAK